ncbi:MAG: (2Fe-2S)-binding protein [Solirubrobacteraceae bacterium]|nr:(2Fe-2S)-binding protein [Solirubrobacteraceae bacterium]
MREIEITVNGERRREAVEDRRLLLDFIREDLCLTGTHAGCEHGACGACTVLLDGQAVRSCLMFAAQADGSELTTIEGVGSYPDRLHPVQEGFWEEHGLQCGYCTPGMIMASIDLLTENPSPSDEEIRERLAGNICRCTGYVNIVRAVQHAAAAGREDQS